MTTALFLLRCVEVGISIRDLDLLTIGMVLDIFVEKWNDNIEENRNTGFVRMAQQADFDTFLAKMTIAFLGGLWYSTAPAKCGVVGSLL